VAFHILEVWESPVKCVSRYYDVDELFVTGFRLVSVEEEARIFLKSAWWSDVKIMWIGERR
jgi:hypothetical protein